MYARSRRCQAPGISRGDASNGGCRAGSSLAGWRKATHEMFKLTNKIALVTGAGTGIGAAIAEIFAKAEARVFVTDVNEAEGRGVVEKLNAAGGHAEFLLLDVRNEGDCQRVAQHVLSNQGRLDVLVNNAGIGSVGTMLQAKGQDLDRLYEVNVRGVFNVTKVFLPSMIERKYGVIINLASIAGIM